MATLKDAVKNAIAYAQDALGEARTREIRLDEVEFDNVKGADSWLITLSMIDPEFPNSLAAAIEGISGHRRREYKVFTVRKDTGEVVAMKIRELQNQ